MGDQTEGYLLLLFSFGIIVFLFFSYVSQKTQAGLRMRSYSNAFVLLSALPLLIAHTRLETNRILSVITAVFVALAAFRLLKNAMKWQQESGDRDRLKAYCESLAEQGVITYSLKRLPLSNDESSQVDLRKILFRAVFIPLVFLSPLVFMLVFDPPIYTLIPFTAFVVLPGVVVIIFHFKAHKVMKRKEKEVISGTLIDKYCKEERFSIRRRSYYNSYHFDISGKYKLNAGRYFHRFSIGDTVEITGWGLTDPSYCKIISIELKGQIYVPPEA